MISTQMGFLYYFSQYRVLFPLSRPNLAMKLSAPRPSSFSVRMPYNHSDSWTIPIHGLASIAANRMRPWPRVHLGGWHGSFLRRLLAPFISAYRASSLPAASSLRFRHPRRVLVTSLPLHFLPSTLHAVNRNQ